MWFPARTTVQPDGEVLSLPDAKTYLRVDGSDQDSTVSDALASAIGHVEAYTGTRALTQTVELRCSTFDDFDQLPIGPVQSISSIAYLDTSGQSQTLDPVDYELFGAGLWRGIRAAIGVNWPSVRDVSDAITVTAIVGYDDEGDPLPAPVLRAILLLLGDFYANREDTIAERSVTPTTLPNGVDTNLVNFRIY